MTPGGIIDVFEYKITLSGNSVVYVSKCKGYIQSNNKQAKVPHFKSIVVPINKKVDNPNTFHNEMSSSQGKFNIKGPSSLTKYGA